MTLSVASREDVTRHDLAAFDGRRQGARISCGSVDLPWQTLTMRRGSLLMLDRFRVADRKGRERPKCARDRRHGAEAALLTQFQEAFPPIQPVMR